MTKSAKKGKASQSNLPELVTVMTKLVERLESLEKKTDHVISRLAALPAEIRQNAPNAAPQAAAPHASQTNHAPRERILHEAVCADCRKGCKVPFRPSESRPVYCPECWAIRKVGHKPQNPDQGSLIPKEKRVLPVFHPMEIVAPPAKIKKPKKTGKSAAKPAKKKKK